MCRGELARKNLRVCLSSIWAETSTGRWFLLRGSWERFLSRAIVFASTEGLRHLAMKAEWYMDGTFNTAPILFRHFCVICARLGPSSVICAYALLTGKSQHLYEETPQAIRKVAKELGCTLDPETVHLDFSRSLLTML